MSQEVEKPTRTRRGRPGTPAMPQQPADESVKGFGPAVPTCGNDLIGLWSLPQEAVTQARLKITRSVPMSQQRELVAECTVQDYTMESIAFKYGKGEYEIILNPGPAGMWPGRRARILISEAYARECGFAPYQEIIPAAAPPRFGEVRSMREAAQALNPQGGQGLTLESMGQLMETIVTRTIAAMRPAQSQGPSMMEAFTLFQTMQANNLKMMAEIAAGRTPAEPADDDDVSWPSVIREALPMLGQLSQGLVSNMRGQQQPAPAAAPAEPEGEVVQVPLSNDEIKHFAGAIGLLKPYAGMVAQIIESSPGVQAAAVELCRYIPDPLKDQVVQFAEMVKTRGPAVLGLLGAELVTDRAAECMVIIGERLAHS